MQPLEASISEYFKDKNGLIAVYLFGSYARGKAQFLSDIDIGIIADREQMDSVRSSTDAYTTELGRRLRKDIHLVILNSASDELLRQVFSKGICLLVRDAKRLALFRTLAYARIAEFGYYRRQTQSGLIRKITQGRTVG